MCLGHGYWPVEWMWVFPIVMPILMLTIVLTILYFCFGRGRCSPPGGNRNDYHDRKGSSDTALNILRERYARGEITQKEYERMKKDVLD